MATCYYQIIYKGNEADLCIDFPDSGFTNLHATFYTDGENVAIPDNYDYEDGELTFHFSPDDFELVNDGVIRYIIEYQLDGEDVTLSTNANAYLKTPADYSGHTEEDYWESGYTSGYTDGYDSGYTDGQESVDCTPYYESGYTDGWNEGYPSGYTDGADSVDCTEAYQSGITEGIMEQKSKLTSLTANTNMIYEREDGYRRVVVSVPQTGYTEEDLDNAFNSGWTNGYDSGYSDGSSSCLIYVQDLIDEGYANVITGAHGTYIDILSGCPYEASQIVDLKEVATNTKKLSGTTDNVIVWDQPKATGFTDTDIASLYSGEALNFTPRGGLLWGLGNIDNFSITFASGSWIAADYPWGSYHSEGVFAPRYNAGNEPYYYSAGFRNTPKNLTVTIDGGYSTVGQVMFTMMKTTTAFTLNVNGFDCHDVTGMFEADTDLQTLNINGRFYWSSFRTMHNLFDGCNSLTGIPINSDLSRDHNYNTIYPHNDGVRGSANCRNIFRNCNSLTYLGPTFNMNAISLSGCVVDNINQEALAGTLFGCPALTDVHIINLNNNDWNFADGSTYTYIPAMNAASIEYLLYNVADVTSQGGHTVTFADTYKNNVSASAITYAQSMGWNVVFGEQPSYSAMPLTFEITSPGYINYISELDGSGLTIEYSTDSGSSWTSITSNTAGTQIQVSSGDVVMFRGDNQGYGAKNSSIGGFKNSTCSFKVYGNIMSLIDSTDFATATTLESAYTFNNLFGECTGLTDAGDLFLPATALTNYCYQSMFNGCVSLTTAPELPATTLASWCYRYMFYNCSSLTKGPSSIGNSATTAKDFSCYSMFNGCTSLTTAPELPATTLANGCYYAMFQNCTNLTTAPALPATRLAQSCYQYMFQNCTSLTSAPELPATTLARQCYISMFANTNVLPDCSNIDFTSATVVASGGLIGLFAGTKVTDNDLRQILPINPSTNNYYLPATTLTTSCYSGMFQGCTSLTTAPELPATTLVENCYRHMFNGCTSINYIKCLATNISANNCITNWVSGVASSGTFVKDPNMTSWTTGDSGIPNGWTVIDAS